MEDTFKIDGLESIFRADVAEDSFNVGGVSGSGGGSFLIDHDGILILDHDGNKIPI
jgi:hypothetical protein